MMFVPVFQVIHLSAGEMSEIFFPLFLADVAHCHDKCYVVGCH